MMTNTLMAAGNFGSPMQLIILLIIVVVLFGSRLPNIGSQLGGAIKGFKKSMSSEDDEEKKADAEKLKHDDLKIIEGAVEKEKEKEQHK